MESSEREVAAAYVALRKWCERQGWQMTTVNDVAAFTADAHLLRTGPSGHYELWISDEAITDNRPEELVAALDSCRVNEQLTRGPSRDVLVFGVVGLEQARKEWRQLPWCRSGDLAIVVADRRKLGIGQP